MEVCQQDAPRVDRRDMRTMRSSAKIGDDIALVQLIDQSGESMNRTEDQ